MASMTVLVLLLSAALLPALLHAEEVLEAPTAINHLLRPGAAVGHHRHHGISCDSWRFGVETNNVRDWKTVPLECEWYVGHYVLGQLYRGDSKTVVEEAVKYAAQLNLTGDGKVPAWIFDIDETILSNLPYYYYHGFGAQPYNSTAFNQWVSKGAAPALPESLRLYKNLLALGIKVVFLTGRGEAQREITINNLKNAGYHTWETLLLRGPTDTGSAVEYKSEKRTKLVAKGYRIVGNVGDQWSDILGADKGERTFKLPDPMYYIA